MFAIPKEILDIVTNVKFTGPLLFSYSVFWMNPFLFNVGVIFEFNTKGSCDFSMVSRAVQFFRLIISQFIIVLILYGSVAYTIIR